MRASRACLIGLIGIIGIVGALVACEPEVGYGTYYCGFEQDCPEGQSCNGPDNRCVRAANAEPFACTVEEEAREPDNTPLEAFQLPELGCVSLPVTVAGCLAEGDGEDWLRFDVPMGCTAVVARMRITYPIAYQEVPFEIATADGVVLEESGYCGPAETDVEGYTHQCLKRTVTPGDQYTLRVKASLDRSCDGGCAYNRYSLVVQLETP